MGFFEKMNLEREERVLASAIEVKASYADIILDSTYGDVQI